jgi:uncharacterized membrane protein YkvA (DUF1232 family)
MTRAPTATAFVALARALRGASRPGEPDVGERVRSVPRMVSATLTGRYQGTSRGRLGLLALAVLYALSPVDLVPEAFVPVLGLADDALVVSWIAGRLLVETDGFLRWEKGRPRRPQHGFVHR